MLSRKLIDCGFEQCLTDTYPFRTLDPRDRSEVKLFLLYRVHNLIVAGSDSDIDALAERQNKFFKTNLLGELVL